MKKHYFIFALFLMGSLLPACSKHSNPGPSTTGTFTISNSTQSGTTSTSADASGVGGIDVSIHTTAGFYLVIYNMPSASSGDTPLQDGNNIATLVGTNPYILSTVNVGQSAVGSSSKSGTLTKTGARSFTFTGVLQTETTGASTTPVTGSGTY